jgi:hypothetical protein
MHCCLLLLLCLLAGQSAWAPAAAALLPG